MRETHPLSPNRDTQPQVPIAKVTTASGPFAGRSTVVGLLLLRRISGSSIYGCGINPKGSMEVTAPAQLGSTVTLSLLDPTNRMQGPGQSLLLLSARPATNFPCGQRIPGFGMIRGAPGEWLIGNVAAVISGPRWTGGLMRISLPIPNDRRLQGAALYAQGALLGESRTGLTDAAELHPGR